MHPLVAQLCMLQVLRRKAAWHTQELAILESADGVPSYCMG